MIDDIKKKYFHFHDAKINRIDFNNRCENYNLVIHVFCLNIENDKYENIYLLLENIYSYNIRYNINEGLMTVFACLLDEYDGQIIVDFDCIYYDEDKLKENSNSKLIIKCKKISFTVATD